MGDWGWLGGNTSFVGTKQIIEDKMGSSIVKGKSGHVQAAYWILRCKTRHTNRRRSFTCHRSSFLLLACLPCLPALSASPLPALPACLICFPRACLIACLQYEVTIEWPPAWAASGYTSLTLGWESPEEAAHWHTLLAAVLRALRAARAQRQAEVQQEQEQAQAQARGHGQEQHGRSGGVGGAAVAAAPSISAAVAAAATEASAAALQLSAVLAAASARDVSNGSGGTGGLSGRDFTPSALPGVAASSGMGGRPRGPPWGRPQSSGAAAHAARDQQPSYNYMSAVSREGPGDEDEQEEAATSEAGASSSASSVSDLSREAAAAGGEEDDGVTHWGCEEAGPGGEPGDSAPWVPYRWVGARACCIRARETCVYERVKHVCDCEQLAICTLLAGQPHVANSRA